jgi:hypothetical protein
MTGPGHSRRSDGQQGLAECPPCLQWRPNLCVATNRTSCPPAAPCLSDVKREAVWKEIETVMRQFEQNDGVVVPTERLVAVGTK